jgi:hypothetical protein
VHQVVSEQEDREEVTKGRQEGRGEAECRGRTTEWRQNGGRVEKKAREWRNLSRIKWVGV